MKIYLIGMPGSGKTTLGQQLADKLDVPFVDLDREIERKEGTAIPEIFATKGEDYFRMRESEALMELASREDSFVLATGGGAPCFYNGIDTLNATGITIFLHVPVHEIARRLRTNTDRPLLKNESEEELEKRLKYLAEKRLPVYNKATIVVSNPTVHTVLQQLKLRR